MIKRALDGIDVDVFYEKLKNGLEVFLVPYKNRKNYYIDYCVKYGAKINSFISSKTNKKIKTPYGVAHFLEHKMFEQEDGVDPFEFFNKSGTGCNASTSYKKTVYYIYGNKELEKNLDFLISYVNSPYFTKENVEKEKGIIEQEMKMYMDNPYSVIFEKMNYNMFNIHNISKTS